MNVDAGVWAATLDSLALVSATPFGGLLALAGRERRWRAALPFTVSFAVGAAERAVGGRRAAGRDRHPSRGRARRELGHDPPPVAAGSFLYIAAADLIPELRRERNLSASVLYVALIMLGIAVLMIQLAF